jgi:hypothetical protein
VVVEPGAIVVEVVVEGAGVVVVQGLDVVVGRGLGSRSHSIKKLFSLVLITSTVVKTISYPVCFFLYYTIIPLFFLYMLKIYSSHYRVLIKNPLIIP